MSKVKFFTKVKLSDLSQSINCFNICGQDLITGDQNGNIVTYHIGKKDLSKSHNANLKSKIEKILIPFERKIALILSGGELYYANLPNLSTVKSLFKSKDTIDFYINKEDKNCFNNVLVINKKRKLKVYDIDYSKGMCSESNKIKDVNLEEMPTCGTWSAGNTFVYSTKSQVIWLHLKDGSINSIDFSDCTNLFSSKGKIGISNQYMTLFMDNGTTCQINPINITVPNFIGYTIFKNHLIALGKNSLAVYQPEQQGYDLVENISINEGESKFIATSDYKVVVCTENNGKTCILDFRERPIEELIKSLVDQGQYNKAVEKVIESTTEDDEEKQQKLEELFLDCAWASINMNNKTKDYDTAIKYLSLTNFNPFEFIYMFYDAINVKIIHEDKKEGIIEQKKMNQLIKTSSKEDEEKKAYKFLIELLLKKRDYLVRKYLRDSAEYEKEKIDFMSSLRSTINLNTSKVEITVRTALDSINLALIKSMIKSHRPPQEIESVLDNKSIDYSIFKDLENDKFFLDDDTKNLNETKFTLAYINEKKGDYESALKEWRNFGISKNEKDNLYSLIGKDRTKNIFYKFKESKSTNREEKEKLFKEYIQWLLLKYPQEAFEVATKTEIVNSKIFLEEIIKDFEKENNIERGKIERQFLEYCNKNQPTEYYQNLLLKLYIDKMILLAPQGPTGELKDELKILHDSFLEIIKNPNSCYNKRKILEDIEKIEWLKKPKIYLYSQLKEYDKALEEFFKEQYNLSFEDIEKFCEENVKAKPDIFQSFYKILSNYVNNEYQKPIDANLEKIKKIKSKSSQLIAEKEKDEAQLKKLEEDIERYERIKKPYEDEMLNLLKKYGKINSIDPEFALANANENWNIYDNNNFFDYLINIVKEYTVEVNKYKIGKNLSDIGLVYKEKEAYEYKKKFVTIDSDKTCDLCKKKIGNTIFVVYPNMKVYHSKCALNHNIDPMTGVDFSKKKYIE